MDKKITGFHRIDCSDYNDLELRSYFHATAIKGIEEEFPDEEVSETSSISFGNIYRNENHISCQIKFNDNNIICQCNYDIKERVFTARIYKLKTIHCCMKVNIDGEIGYMFYKNDVRENIKC